MGSALEDENVDGALVILTPQSMTDIDTIAEEVCNVAAAHDKPTYCSFMGETDVASGIGILQRRNIPHYILPESMCRAFARAHDFSTEKDRHLTPAAQFADVDTAAARRLLDAAIASGRTYLTPSDAMKVLEAYRLPVLPSAVAQSADAAARVAAQVGFPVAMKVESDDVVHKFDIGAVMLGLDTPAAATSAYATILANVKARQPDARVHGVFVQRMAGAGDEVILGVKRDPAFGAVVMFGLGGLFVEIFRDVAFRIAPIPLEHIRDMMHEVKAFPILTGARGRPHRDTAAVEECLQRLSQLVVDCPQIQELDINPLIVRNQGDGCAVTDARILVAAP
jgi:acetyltransferase